MHSIETGRGDFLLEVGAYRWRSAFKTFTPSIETRLPKRMYEAELADLLPQKSNKVNESQCFFLLS